MTGVVMGVVMGTVGRCDGHGSPGEGKGCGVTGKRRGSSPCSEGMASGAGTLHIMEVAVAAHSSLKDACRTHESGIKSLTEPAT